MARIKILPEILSNKIAAGEVVERPSSVVKELLENSIDAQSTRILIEVEKGGRSLIRVSDNGEGMEHDDALLSLERYATSKIFSDKDLFAINTLGFRGEALPSIAAVSKMTIVSRPSHSGAGTHIHVEGGRIMKVLEVGAPQGTVIEVRQLFYNTPARRKFLKTITTEMGHITDTVSRIAMGCPQVRFELRHNGKVVGAWYEVVDPSERVSQLLGRDTRSHLLHVNRTEPSCRITGWIADPHCTRATSRAIYFFVNGRHVNNKILTHALLEGYQNRLMKRRFPVGVLFLSVPADEVDVNVHPAKAQVRLRHQERIHRALVEAVSACLKSLDRPVWGGSRVPASSQQAVAEALSGPLRSSSPSTPPGPGAASPQQASQTSLPLPQRESTGFGVVGQFADTYILCEARGGLLLVDQHAAHERILFEQFRASVKQSAPMAQRLLIPETLELDTRQARILETLIPALAKTGLDIEPFGGETFVIRSVPSLLAQRQVQALVCDVVDKMTEIGFDTGMDRAIDECLILMACHGAVRANHRLSADYMRILMAQLEACEHPSQCPHGRPTWIRWTL
ncbi:DNA mismatch repair endonuclease MutL, partial [Thermodesulfobacteriota bacterium]